MSEYGKLAWQCRRGTKELDLLLTAYLNVSFDNADVLEKSSFMQLLNLDDNAMMGLLLGDGRTHCKSMDAVIDKIRKISNC
jgi:antitoxin CptB